MSYKYLLEYHHMFQNSGKHKLLEQQHCKWKELQKDNQWCGVFY